MNGITPNESAIGSNPGPGWHVIGAGDFNGDGDTDILWQNANGQAGDLADERHHRFAASGRQ